MLTRRRFIAISAALAPSLAMGNAPDLHVETGRALGATVTLRLQHPDAPRLAASAMAEIRRLERIFSLYLPDSALVRLNRDCRLDAPPFELLDCLTLAGMVYRTSNGRFDPTIQPLWQAQATALARGTALTDAERGRAKALIGWDRIRLAAESITLEPGMALTLNGIAQGFIADRVAGLLAEEGLTRALINTGELVALPEGEWPVIMPSGETFALRGRAVATSAPLGMTFGGDGQSSHILDPATARPVLSHWQSVSISAQTAALADALSTAACLASTREEIALLCEAFPGTTVQSARAA